MEDRPRLPPEILEQIVWQLHEPCSLGDPIAQRTLSSLSLVSRICRQWALAAKYSVVIAPRHVRDFRKWHQKVSYELVGYNRALFVALDDVSDCFFSTSDFKGDADCMRLNGDQVSKLTSTSAGWEADLQRLLQRLGPNLTHLSLWGSETRAVLRDPAQIRGPRFRNRMPTETMDEVISSTVRRRHKLERTLRKKRLGQWTDPALKPLKVEKGRDEQRTRAEIAAARERARQKMPNWLKRELETKKEEEVERIYKAHIGITVREYQHELDAQEGLKLEKKGENKEDVQRHADKAENDKSSLASSEGTNTDEEQRGSTSSDSDDDYDDLDWGCMPIKLSICPALPLHEHENALNFARMTLWTRVQELDVFVSVPGEVERYLELFSSLVACPIAQFRLSSIYASLLIAIDTDQSGQPCCNLARGLGRVMDSRVLRSLLLHEYSDNHIDDVSVLEAAVASAIVSASSKVSVESFDDELRNRERIAKDTIVDSRVRVKILQGNQGYWGKLKDRRRDFLNRTLHLAKDCWDTHLRLRDD